MKNQNYFNYHFNKLNYEDNFFVNNCNEEAYNIITNSVVVKLSIS